MSYWVTVNQVVAINGPRWMCKLRGLPFVRRSIEFFDSSITTNLGPMWRAAGVDLKKLNGTTGRKAAPQLLAAVETLERDPDRFRAMNPANGWGDYEGCVDFLRRLHEACATAPRATVRVST